MTSLPTKTYIVFLKSAESDNFHYGFINKKVEATGRSEQEAMFNAERNNEWFIATSAQEQPR